MSGTNCPSCGMNGVLEHPDLFECMTCGHDWPEEAPAEFAGRVVQNVYGNVLADGDIVAMVKDLKLDGTSQVLKTRTKSKPIRFVEGDHEISWRMSGLPSP